MYRGFRTPIPTSNFEISGDTSDMGWASHVDLMFGSEAFDKFLNETYFRKIPEKSGGMTNSIKIAKNAMKETNLFRDFPWKSVLPSYEILSKGRVVDTLSAIQMDAYCL
eukprot:64246_1